MSPLSFTELLDLLDHDDHVALCTSSNGIFSSQVVTAKHAKNYQVPQDRDAWYSVNPMQGPARMNAGRGDVTQVVRLAALYADLDVKPGGLADFDTANALIGDLSTALHARPSATTISGNGLQPYWPIEDEITGLDAMALLRRWGRLVRHFAGLRGGKVDSVYDLTRILRIPGSFNHKTPPAKPVLCLPDTGRPLAVEEVEQALDENSVVEQPEDRQQVGAVVAPPSQWEHQQRTCNYVDHMVTNWATDTPDARHPWLISQATRIAAAHRHGCLTEVDHTAALQALHQRFQGLLSDAPQRDEQPAEFADAVAWGQGLVATKTDTEVHAELGSHVHAAAPLRGSVDDLTDLLFDMAESPTDVAIAQLPYSLKRVLGDHSRVPGVLDMLREAARDAGVPDPVIEQILTGGRA